MSTQDKTVKTANAAWNQLIKCGGIELKEGGRDAGFEDRLIALLPVSDTEFDQALKKVSLEDFLSAFMSVAQPYMIMFKEILLFYQNATANKELNNWKLDIEGEKIGLEHFNKAIEFWNELTTDHCFYDIDYSTIWAPWTYLNELQAVPLLQPQTIQDHVNEENSEWLKSFRKDLKSCPDFKFENLDGFLGVSSLASIFDTVFSLLRAGGRSHEQIMENWNTLSIQISLEDLFNIPGASMLESDYWIDKMVHIFDLFHNLSDENKKAFDDKICNSFFHFPEKSIGIKCNYLQVENFLSLPLWQRRHELYSVWIATLIIKSAQDKGHTISFYKDGKGYISFPFKETKIATVQSSSNVYSLVSEKRKKLTNPVGTGRKSNVQPDFVMESEKFPNLVTMVIEVKQYKKSAKGNFSKALTDYARAFDCAKVWLVNHGPILDSVKSAVEYDVRERCETLGDLRADNHTAVSVFNKVVNDCLGKPQFEVVQTERLQAVDVSGSMTAFFDSYEFQGIFDELCRDNKIENVVCISDRVHGVVEVEEATEIIKKMNGGANQLCKCLQMLGELGDSVWLLTDNDGVDELHNLIVEKKAVRENIFNVRLKCTTETLPE